MASTTFHQHAPNRSHTYDNGTGNLPSASASASASNMPSPSQSVNNANELFPLDFLSFSNFDSTSPNPNPNASTAMTNEKDNAGATPGSMTGMDFDLSQFQNQNSGQNQNLGVDGGASGSGSIHSQSHSAGGSRRGSVDLKRAGGRKRLSVASSSKSAQAQATATAMDIDLQIQQNQMNEFQAMLDAATASSSSHPVEQDGYDQSAMQASLLQQQLEHIHMQSPMIFGNANGNSNGQQSNFNPMAQYLTSPPAGELSQLANGELDAEKKKWMLATGLGGMFTPGPSGEMIPQIRPDQMSPMQLEMLAREFDTDFSNVAPLMSPALSQQQSSSSYTSPHPNAAFSVNGSQQAFNGQLPAQSQTRSPLEALQIQQRHFQEQLALLQHQQRQLQATAEAVAAASTSPYVAATNGSSASGSSRPVTTPGVNGGPHSTNPSPSYFSPLTSPALEASNRNGQFSRHQHFSPGFDPRVKRAPHPLSALSSPALNPVGSSGGAQQTLSPALAPQNNADMSDPEYFRALVGMLDGNQAQPQTHQQSPNQQMQMQLQHQQQQPQSQYQAQQQYPQRNQYDGSGSNYPSPALLQTIDTSSLSSPMVGPSSATSNTGPGPNRHSLPTRTRPSPMIKPTPGHRGHHSRGPSTSNHPSPIVSSSHRYNGGAVPQPNYLPPAAIDQRGYQAHHQQLALSTTSTPSPVDLATMMPPPPVPNNVHGKSVTPMTPASLMNLAGGRPAQVDNHLHQEIQQGPPKRQGGARAGQVSRPVRKPTANGAGPAAGPSSGGQGAGSQTTGKKGKLTPSGKRTLAARPPGVGVRAATKGAAAAAAASLGPPEGENRKTSHKAAEQKRRDSLKAGFDELRLLLPPINTEALDPESGEPIPGSSAPRLLPKSSLVPDDNPNRGVSKVALLKFSNEYIERLHEKIDKRDDYIERLRAEVSRLRTGSTEDEVKGGEGEDLLEMDMLDGEEDYDENDDEEGGEEGDEGEEEEGKDVEGEGDELDEMELDGEEDEEYTDSKARRRSKGGVMGKSPALGPTMGMGQRRPVVSRVLSNGQMNGKGRRVEA